MKFNSVLFSLLILLLAATLAHAAIDPSIDFNQPDAAVDTHVDAPKQDIAPEVIPQVDSVPHESHEGQVQPEGQVPASEPAPSAAPAVPVVDPVQTPTDSNPQPVDAAQNPVVEPGAAPVATETPAAPAVDTTTPVEQPTSAPPSDVAVAAPPVDTPTDVPANDQSAATPGVEIVATPTQFSIAVPDGSDVNSTEVEPVKDEAVSAQLDDVGKGLLTDCSNGVGEWAILQPGCQLLDKGLKFGKSKLLLTSLRKVDDVSHPAFEGTLDMRQWFGTKAPIFKFRLDKKKGSGLGLRIWVDGGFRLSLADILRRMMPPNSFGMLTPVMDKMGFNKIALTLNELGVNIAPFGIRLSGSASLFDLKVNFNILMARLNQKLVLAADFSVPGEGFNSFISKMLGPAADMIQIFELVSLDLTLSTSQAKLTNYPALAWNGAHDLKKGIELALRARFNSHSNNTLFKMLSKMMPGDMSVSVAFDGASFSLNLELPEIVFDKHFAIAAMKITVTAGLNPLKISLAASGGFRVSFQENKLQFLMAIEAQLQDPALQIQLSMDGMWYRAFGAPFLSLGNIIGAVQLTARPPWFASLTLGGTIAIGDPHNEPITGKVYARVDIANPANNYFYGQVTTFTVGKVLNVIAGLKNLPKQVADTGFPEGALLSYSASGTTTAAGDDVPLGFHIKGKAQFLSKFAALEVLISPTNFLFYVEFSPFEIGAIKFLRSPTNHTHGPLARVEGSLIPFSFSCNIEGFIDVFLFKSYVKILVQSRTMQFHVDAVLFRFLEAKIDVNANAESLLNPVFDFKADITTRNLKQKLISELQQMTKKVSQKMQDARDKVTRAQKKLDDKAKNLCGPNLKKCDYSCNVQINMELASEAHSVHNDDMLVRTAASNRPMLLEMNETNLSEMSSALLAHTIASGSEAELVAMGLYRSDADVDNMMRARFSDEQDQRDWNEIVAEDLSQRNLLELYAQHDESQVGSEFESAISDAEHAAMVENWRQEQHDIELLEMSSSMEAGVELKRRADRALVDLSIAVLDESCLNEHDSRSTRPKFHCHQQQHQAWIEAESALQLSMSPAERFRRMFRLKHHQKHLKYRAHALKHAAHKPHNAHHVSDALRKVGHHARAHHGIGAFKHVIQHAAKQKMNPADLHKFNQKLQEAQKAANAKRAAAAKMVSDHLKRVAKMKPKPTPKKGRPNCRRLDLICKFKRSLEKTANSLCRGTKSVGRKVCQAGCKASQGLLQSLKKTLETSKKFLSSVEKTSLSFIGIIEKIVRSIDIDIHINSSLNVQQFSFNTDFHIRFGKVKIDWKVAINFKFSNIEQFFKMIFKRIKDWLSKKVPGLNKLLK